MRNLKLIIAIILLLSLYACSRGENASGSHIMTIEQHSFANHLYYSGTVQPLETLVIPSPAEGVVVEMPFQYGEPVKAGDLLYLISSSKFLTDYKSALTQFIKAKSEFNISQTQLTEAKFLHKNLLISDDEFKMKESGYYSAQLTLLQAKDALEIFLQQLDIKDINLQTLNIADIDKITKAMHLKMNSESLKITAPADGIVLSPSKNDEESKKILKGDAVKQGDVLAVLGDMNGLSVRIKVNELVINQLKTGQKVKITGIAFPDYVLNGAITRVDRQGEGANSGLPTFMVEVAVPKLTPDQQKFIHAGMSAKVEIDIDEEPQITVPITAVSERNGESYIKLVDAKTGQPRDVLVKTGKTTTDAVAILSGLKIGDKIVVSN